MIQLQALMANKKVAIGMKILILIFVVGLAGLLFWMENRAETPKPFCSSTYSECFYRDLDTAWLALVCPKEKLILVANDVVEKIWSQEQIEEIKHFLNCCFHKHKCIDLYYCEGNFFGLKLFGELGQINNMSLSIQPLDKILNKYY